MKQLEIIPIVGLGPETKERDSPNSASSMRVNTPWEKSPSFFRAEDIVGLIRSDTPTDPSGGGRNSIPPESPVPFKASPPNNSPKQDGPNIGSPQMGSPKTPQKSPHAKDRPTSPKERNSSQSRRQPTPHPALVNHDLIHEPAIASIIVPEYVEATPLLHAVCVSNTNLIKEKNETSRSASLAPRDERNWSPRPRSTGW
jgi:hypothetical protein